MILTSRIGEVRPRKRKVLRDVGQAGDQNECQSPSEDLVRNQWVTGPDTPDYHIQQPESNTLGNLIGHQNLLAFPIKFSRPEVPSKPFLHQCQQSLQFVVELKHHTFHASTIYCELCKASRKFHPKSNPTPSFFLRPIRSSILLFVTSKKNDSSFLSPILKKKKKTRFPSRRQLFLICDTHH